MCMSPVWWDTGRMWTNDSIIIKCCVLWKHHAQWNLGYYKLTPSVCSRSSHIWTQMLYSYCALTRILYQKTLLFTYLNIAHIQRGVGPIGFGYERFYCREIDKWSILYYNNSHNVCNNFWKWRPGLRICTQTILSLRWSHFRSTHFLAVNS